MGRRVAGGRNASSPMPVKRKSRRAATPADRRPQRRNRNLEVHNTGATADSQRARREFVPLEIVVVLLALGCSTAERIVFRQRKGADVQI
jgi:hypothetical protein